MTVDSKGRGLFIVDNSVSGWTGLRYLEEWSSIAKAFDESIPKLVETRVTSGRSGCGMSLAIGMDDPEFLLNRGTERREVAIAE